MNNEEQIPEYFRKFPISTDFAHANAKYCFVNVRPIAYNLLLQAKNQNRRDLSGSACFLTSNSRMYVHIGWINIVAIRHI